LRIQALDPSVVAMYCQPEETPELLTFRLAGREHLQGISVAEPELGRYQTLLAEGLA
jgi:hypothetical protein